VAWIVLDGPRRLHRFGLHVCFLGISNAAAHGAHSHTTARAPLRKLAALAKAQRLAKKNEDVKDQDLVRMVIAHRAVKRKQAGGRKITVEW
jgi:hypothetical protein